MNKIDTSFLQAELILKFLKGELSKEEQKNLEQWRLEDPDNELLFQELSDASYLTEELKFFQSLKTDAAWEKLSSHAFATPKKAKYSYAKLFRWAAAASIVFITFLFLYMYPSVREKSSLTKISMPAGSNIAKLILADGSIIPLDKASDGEIAHQGSTKIIKVGDLISYTPSGKERSNDYNTIETPMGGQYQLILSDGSKVWLNAASSLKFPAYFQGTKRIVELKGEGYFEVAHKSSQPFQVLLSNDSKIEVLGTSFNVNTYKDEKINRATLLKGKLRIVTKTDSQILEPGNQAQFEENSSIQLSENADLEEVMAWKNGNFIFNSRDIKSIMRQISRWYNVEVKYEGKINQETFSGIVSRQSNLSQVLKIMEEGGVKFKIENKTITVY